MRMLSQHHARRLNGRLSEIELSQHASESVQPLSTLPSRTALVAAAPLKPTKYSAGFGSSERSIRMTTVSPGDSTPSLTSHMLPRTPVALGLDLGPPYIPSWCSSGPRHGRVGTAVFVKPDRVADSSRSRPFGVRVALPLRPPHCYASPAT